MDATHAAVGSCKTATLDSGPIPAACNAAAVDIALFDKAVYVVASPSPETIAISPGHLLATSSNLCTMVSGQLETCKVPKKDIVS